MTPQAKPQTCPRINDPAPRTPVQPSSRPIARQWPVQATGDPLSLGREIAEAIRVHEYTAVEGDGDVPRGLHAFRCADIVTRTVHVDISAFSLPLDESLPEEVTGTVRGVPFRAWLVSLDGKVAIYEVEQR